ncbi:MAG: MFS transporter [Mycobacteriales bacterium]
MLPVVLLASFMAQFDTFVVNVAAPSLRSNLHASDIALELIVGGYAFAYGSGMVTGGRLGDMYGHRRLFLIGMASFSLASLLCGLSNTPSELVAARLLQGVTGALMVPQILALITAPFAPHEGGRTMAWFGVTAGIASVAGQILGGLLLDADFLGLGWRTIFLINVPIGVITIGLAWRLVPRVSNPRQASLDLLGTLGVSLSLALALIPLMLGRNEHWPAWTWICLVTSLPVITATMTWERKVARLGGQPLLNPALFRNRSFAVGLVINVAFMAFFGSFIFTLTLLLQSGLGLSALHAGLTFAPLGALLATTSVLGRRLMGHYGLKILTLGAGISAVGVVTLAVELHVLAGSITTPWLVPPLALVGLGNGLVMPLLMGAVLAGVDPTQAGAAAGVLTTSQQFANAAGVAVLGSVLFAALGGAPTRTGFTSAMQLTAVLDLVLLLITIALTFLLPQNPARAKPLRGGAR